MITLSIPSSSNELDRVLDFISLGQEVVNCSIEYWMELLDTAQKVFISIVKYAYPTQDGIVKISLNYMREQQVIEVSFINEGIPYNPLEALNNSTRLTRENRLESKIGISIIEKVTEETSYLYLNKKNITAIRKYIV